MALLGIQENLELLRNASGRLQICKASKTNVLYKTEFFNCFARQNYVYFWTKNETRDREQDKYNGSS